jgi:septal ring factor EnvC (AmiA/AmiB activator)
MKRFLFIVMLISIPSITLAAWWNPLTWFNKTPEPVVTQTILPEPNYETPEPTIETDPAVVAPQVVTKTITVQDPKLQQQIDALLQENSQLQIQVANLKKANTTLSGELANLENTPTVDSECADAKDLAVELAQQIPVLKNKFLAEATAIQSNSNGMLSSGVAAEISALNARESAATEALYAKVNAARVQVAILCE